MPLPGKLLEKRLFLLQTIESSIILKLRRYDHLSLPDNSKDAVFVTKCFNYLIILIWVELHVSEGFSDGFAM